MIRQSGERSVIAIVAAYCVGLGTALSASVAGFSSDHAALVGVTVSVPVLSFAVVPWQSVLPPFLQRAPRSTIRAASGEHHLRGTLRRVAGRLEPGIAFAVLVSAIVTGLNGGTFAIASVLAIVILTRFAFSIGDAGGDQVDPSRPLPRDSEQSGQSR